MFPKIERKSARVGPVLLGGSGCLKHTFFFIAWSYVLCLLSNTYVPVYNNHYINWLLYMYYQVVEIADLWVAILFDNGKYNVSGYHGYHDTMILLPNVLPNSYERGIPVAFRKYNVRLMS